MAHKSKKGGSMETGYFCVVCGLASERTICEKCNALGRKAAQLAVDTGRAEPAEAREVAMGAVRALQKAADAWRAIVGGLPVTFIRARRTLGNEPAAHYPPKRYGHESAGSPCLACGWPMLPGQSTALVVLGPGRDAEARAKCSDGRKYNARAIELHADCAGITNREGEGADNGRV